MITDYITSYGKRLYGLCISLCSDKYDADDLYQETWLRVFQKLSGYDTSKGFEQWLTTICVNLYRDRLRKNKRSPVFDKFESTEQKDMVIEQIPVSDINNDYSDLRSAIDDLPAKLRTTVILHYYRDMNVEETARILRIPVGTVKSRLSKARILLKEVLKDGYL